MDINKDDAKEKAGVVTKAAETGKAENKTSMSAARKDNVGGSEKAKPKDDGKKMEESKAAETAKALNKTSMSGDRKDNVGGSEKAKVNRSEEKEKSHAAEVKGDMQSAEKSTLVLAPTEMLMVRPATVLG